MSQVIFRSVCFVTSCNILLALFVEDEQLKINVNFFIYFEIVCFSLRLCGGKNLFHSQEFATFLCAAFFPYKDVYIFSRASCSTKPCMLSEDVTLKVFFYYRPLLIGRILVRPDSAWLFSDFSTCVRCSTNKTKRGMILK